MPPSCLRRTFDAEISRIRKMTGRSRRMFGLEAIHDLRVEIKRLRALFDLIEACRPRFPRRKRFKPFRRLFKAAGGLREAQVESSLARDKATSPRLDLDAYRNVLKDDELRARRRFCAAAKAFERGSSLPCRKAIDKALDGLDPRSVQTAIEARCDKLRRGLLQLKRAKLAKRGLHAIRVRAKRMHDTLEILQGCFRPDDAALAGLNESLRAVHQALGRWHDLELAAASLRDFLANRAVRPLAEEPAYTDYARLMRADSRRHLAAFEKAWENFIRRASSRRITPTAGA